MKLLYTIAVTILFVMTAAAAGGVPVKYKVDGEKFEGYYTSPSADAPLVFMVHDWDGLTEYEVKRAQMLNDLGYAVFAVDMFGEGVRPTATADKKKLTGELYKNRERMRKLLYGGMAAASQMGGDINNAVAIGYCFGGAVILELARSGADLKGFVTFHGGLNTPEGQNYADTKGKVLVLHGTADQAVSMEDFASLAVQLEDAKVPHEMTTYSGAPHAFTVFGSPNYHEEADIKSWERFTGFLVETFK
ncbi:dienelactone hydrolase [Denitrovibrio acetiphilus DSM 12809]|uniref:Dienelactone hydrolase n=1 Tax=Denitrovibrio acetiphilus (strain DSM 12809 / NBRC 114555 / N2460) TaxID=522772 RepID=D4H6P5_DENA2|nr:dienelactone hydrolase family protein [Denitrovibrio acetiphilus]ADD67761.1 dienelactone hydrolase [Denitrovibrio acetiphilus DSM 12809]